MKKKRLIVDETEYIRDKLEPRAAKLLAFCRTMPDDKAITTANANAALHCSTVRALGTHPALAPYTTLIRRNNTEQRIWGNAKTIAAVKRGDY